MGDTQGKGMGKKLYGSPDITKTGPKANADGPIGRKTSASLATGPGLTKAAASDIGAKKPKASMTTGTKGDKKGEDSGGSAY